MRILTPKTFQFGWKVSLSQKVCSLSALCLPSGIQYYIILHFQVYKAIRTAWMRANNVENAIATWFGLFIWNRCDARIVCILLKCLFVFMPKNWHWIFVSIGNQSFIKSFSFGSHTISTNEFTSIYRIRFLNGKVFELLTFFFFMNVKLWPVGSHNTIAIYP